MAKILTLFGSFDSPKELINFSNAQYLALQSADLKIKKLEEEVKHLQQLLSSTTPILGEQKVETLLVTKEEALIDEQINILYQRSLSKELNLEETKKLDLFIKNKNLLKGQATGIIDTKSKRLKQEISEARLIQIASTPIQSDE